MFTLVSKKKAVVFGASFLVAASGAFAYWTTTGAGTGSAGTGTTEAIVVKQTSTITGLYPGGAAVALSGNFDNPNSGPVQVATVTVALASISNGAGTPACTIADYEISAATVTLNVQLPSGLGVGSWSGPGIRMLNSGTNQDACKNATVNLTYTSN